MKFPGNFRKVEFIINNASGLYDPLAGYYHHVDVVKRIYLLRLLQELSSFRILDSCPVHPAQFQDAWGRYIFAVDVA
jgi:hypothetical protein